jgi:hypothetical protein
MDSAVQTQAQERDLKRQVRAAVRKWVKLLGLSNKQVRVIFSKAPAPLVGEAYAAAYTLNEYGTMTIIFDVAGMPPHEDIDQMVAHELTHFHIDPIQRAADDFVEAIPDPAIQDVVRKAVERALERTTTDVASIFVKLAAGKDYGVLLFDDRKEPPTDGLSPESGVGTGARTRRKPSRSAPRVRRHGGSA